jgi:hypothetical protein
MSLCKVPFEIVRLIVENLDPDDMLQLASTSRHFKHIIHDKFISRKALEVSCYDRFSIALVSVIIPCCK